MKINHNIILSPICIDLHLGQDHFHECYVVVNGLFIGKNLRDLIKYEKI